MLVLHSPQHCTVYPQATSLHIAQGHKPTVQNSQLAPHMPHGHTLTHSHPRSMSHTLYLLLFLCKIFTLSIIIRYLTN